METPGEPPGFPDNCDDLPIESSIRSVYSYLPSHMFQQSNYGTMQTSIDSSNNSRNTTPGLNLLSNNGGNMPKTNSNVYPVPFRNNGAPAFLQTDENSSYTDLSSSRPPGAPYFFPQAGASYFGSARPSNNLLQQTTEIRQQPLNLRPHSITPATVQQSQNQIAARQESQSSQISSRSIPLLKDWLQRFWEGKNLMRSYDIEDKLTDSQRSTIVRLLFEREHFYRGTHNYLSSKQFVAWSIEVVELFPTETKGIYYVPSVKKTAQTDGSQSLGKIIQHLNYIRKVDSKISPTGKKRPSIEMQEEDTGTNEAAKRALEELQGELDDWSLVEEKYQTALTARLELMKTGCTIYDLMRKIPSMRQPKGFKLFESDFAREHPTSYKIFQTRWPLLRTKLKELLIGLRRPSVKELRPLLHGLQVATTDSAIDAHIFKLLPALFHRANLWPNETFFRPPIGKKLKQPRLSPEDKKWTPSLPQSQAGFAVHVKVANDKDNCLKTLRDELKSMKMAVQPRMVLVGELNNIEASYSMVDDYCYSHKSPSEALEQTFYSIWALNARYPPEAKSCWTFIQKAAFGFNGGDDLIGTKVEALLADVKDIFPVASSDPHQPVGIAAT